VKLGDNVADRSNSFERCLKCAGKLKLNIREVIESPRFVIGTQMILPRAALTFDENSIEIVSLDKQFSFFHTRKPQKMMKKVHLVTLLPP